MSDMYRKLKKLKGETFTRIIRDHHNGLLEIPDLDGRLRYAGDNATALLPYLISVKQKLDHGETELIETNKSPYELLKEAGYNAFHADSLDKQNSIQHHYAKGELLCTFNDASRFKNYHIIHAIKENADDIRREDFQGKEARQDEYGTSVISIQVAKNGSFISIKNRYNHTVKACDNTFNSNPDEIIPGLTDSIKKEFNVELNIKSNTLPHHYLEIEGKAYHYHDEIDDIYYGDGFYAQRGKITFINKKKGEALFDQFFFDPENKKLISILFNDIDPFAHDFNRDYKDVKHRLFVREGNLYLRSENKGDKHTLLIEAKNSRIKKLHLDRLTQMNSYCLFRADALTHFQADNIIYMDACSLYATKKLKYLSVNSLREMGGTCLPHASNLTPCRIGNKTTILDRINLYILKNRIKHNIKQGYKHLRSKI